MRKSYRDDNGEKIFRYSIRKYHFGAASVAVAALMFFANGAVAASETITPVTASDVVTAGSDGNADGNPASSDEGDSKQALTDKPAELKAADELKTQEAPTEGANQGQAVSKPAEVDSNSSQPGSAQETPQAEGEKEQEQPAAANTEAAKSTQGNLQALLEKLTLSSMQELHAEVEARLAAAKAVLEDSKATQAQVDEQARLMAELMSRVNQALTPALENPTILEKAGLTSTSLTPTGLASPEGATTAQTSGGKGRRRTLSEPTSDENQVRPSAGGDSTGSGAGSQATPQTLPTYTNTEGKNGVYGLKDELEFITEQLRANGASADKIQAAKAAADKFNEAFSKGNTISQEDFSAALADLKKSRGLIEGVLRENDVNAGEVTGPVNPAESATPSENNVTIQPRTNTRGWSGFRNVPAGVRTRNARSAGQNRDASNNFENSRQFYFEDGKYGSGSGYDKYSYIFYSRRELTASDYNNGAVSRAPTYIYADVNRISNGFTWDIYVNRGNHGNLAGSRVWFTVPKNQVIVQNSVNIGRGKNPDSGTSKGFGNNVVEALRDGFTGFSSVSEGTPKRSNIQRISKELVERYPVGNLDELSRHTGGYNGQNYYVRNLESSKDIQRSNAKFNKINDSFSTMYSFILPDTADAYRISFVTRGDNIPEQLVYAVGMRGTAQSVGKKVGYLVNQFYARTNEDLDKAESNKFKILGNTYFKIKQNTINAELGGAEGESRIRGGITYIARQGDYTATQPKMDGVLTYDNASDITNYNSIDISSYGDYYETNGITKKDRNKGQQDANGDGQQWHFYKYGSKIEISKSELTFDAIRTPGVHTYEYVRTFTKDGSGDKGKFSFVTKPKRPTLDTDLSRLDEGRHTLTASNGTEGYNMVLYKKAADGTLTKVAEQVAGVGGRATFENVDLKLGEYVVKTVVKGTWYDYHDNDKEHKTVESDESNSRSTIKFKMGVSTGNIPGTQKPNLKDEKVISYPANDIVTNNSVKFIARSSKNIKKLVVTGAENIVAANEWHTDGLNSQEATIRIEKRNGFDGNKRGVYELTVTATADDNSISTYKTHLFIPPTAGSFETTSDDLREKSNSKPQVTATGLLTNLRTLPGYEWKAYLVKGGQNNPNSYVQEAQNYTVVAATNIQDNGKAVFNEADYRQPTIGTDNLRLVTALVKRGTDQIFENLNSSLSTSTIKATVPRTDYAQKPGRLTFIQGETPTWGDPKSYFTYGDGSAIGSDRTFVWKDSFSTTAPRNPDLSIGTGKTIEVLASNPGGTPKTINLTYDVVAPVTPKNSMYTIKGKDFVKPNTTTAAVASDFYNNTEGKTITWKVNSALDKNAAVGQNHTATATVAYPGVDKDGNAITRDIAVTYGIVDSSLTKNTWAADYNGKLTTGTGNNPDADARNYISKDSYTNGKISRVEFVATSRTSAEAPSTTKPGSVNKEIKVTYDNGQTQNFGLLVQVRPDKPRVTDNLGEKAGLSNQTVTVSNVPTNAGTVNVTLKADGKVIAGTRTTVNGSTATVTVPGDLPKGAITATVALTNTSHDYQTNRDNNYTLNSDESDPVNSRGRKPQKPEIRQDKEGDLAVTATIGQDGANKAIFSYTTTGNQSKEITFEKGRDGTWSKVGATADSTVAIRNNANGTAEIHMTGGTANAGTSVSIKQQTAYSDFTEAATLTAYGRMTTPNLNAREDTSVTITPASDANKLTVTYTPSNQTAATTVTLTKNNAGQWQNQTGFNVSGNTVTLTAGTAKAGTTVSAKAESSNTISLVGTANAKPAVPTVNGSGAYANDLDSTSRTITGRGLPGATVKITLQNGQERTATVESNGNWSYTLAANEALTQTALADNTSGYSNRVVSVKQVVNNVESGSVNKTVLIGFPTLDNPVAAGRDITFSLPKDVGLSYIQFNNGYGEEVTVKRDNGVWKLDGRFKDKLRIETVTQDNPSITKLKISVTNPTTESAIPFRLVEGERKIRLRMHKANASGAVTSGTSQITVGEGSNRADWIYANVTNEKPSIAAKTTIKDTYVANEKLTKAKLLDLVTVTDAEDDAAKTVGQTAKQKVTVAITKGDQAVTLADGDYLKEGDYNLVYSTSDAAGKAADNLTRTIHVQSIKDATNITLTQKEEFTSSDVTNNSFTDTAKDRFVAKIKQQNPNLPANTRVEKVTDPGLGNVAKIIFEDGSEKLVTGSDIAVPTQPVVTPEAGYGQNLSSTTRSISGTGIPGATIKITLQNNKEVSTTVGTTGAWTYDLQDGELLSQNEKQDATTKVANPVSVKQEIGGMISAPQNVTVSLGQARFEGTPLQAGRDIVVRVPHDASRFYVTIASKDGSKYQYGVSKTAAGGWQVVEERSATSGGSFTATGRSTTDLTEEQSNNPSEKLLKLHIKDANTKADIPFTIPSGPNSVIARVHYDNRNVSPAGDFARATATNTGPSIAVNEPNTHDYTADGSLTLAGLKSLVTVTDAEDDANKTVGSPARENVSVTIQKDGQAVTLATNDYLKKGDYTVTYTVRDAAGATATKTHTLTVSSLAESKGSSITYPSEAQKVVYGNAQLSNSNFTPDAKKAFADKLAEVNKNNTNLPTINGQGVTFTAGATDDKNKVVTVRFPDGSSLDVPSDKLAKRRPTQPEITSDNNGDVTVTPVNEPNVNSLKVTYTPADNHQLQEDGTVTTTPQTETEVIATKGADNQWTITKGKKDGIDINPTTGAITLKDEVVKDRENVTAKVAAQGIESDAATDQAGTGDQVKPVIGASSKIVEVGTNVDIPLNLTDAGVGIDDTNIKVTGLPTGLSYNTSTKLITGTLGSVSKNEVKVTVLDKNGNKAEKTISLVAVKPKPIFTIKDATITDVDNAANFVETPAGVNLTATWKDGNKPTTAAVGTTNKTVTVSLDGASADLTIPVTVYPNVTYRNNGQEVPTYQEIVGQPLSSRLVQGGGSFNAVTPEYFVAFKGGNKPAGTIVEFVGGAPADTSTTAGLTTKTIRVTYPNNAGTVEKPVNFKTYGNKAKLENGKDYSAETTVGTAFAKTNARDYVEPSNPSVPNPGGTVIGWGNGVNSPNPVSPAQTKIGVREENVNVWYGSSVQNARGDNTNNYNEQNVKVAVAVKPKAPTLQGQAGTKPAVTVSNLPEASQLATGATVKVQLKDAKGTVVAEKEVTAGATTVTFDKADYKKDLTLGEQLNATVLVAGTYKKTVKTDNRTEQVDTPYALSSANSNQETVKTYADFYRNQVTYPKNAEKATYGNSDIANGNFKDVAKERFATKIKEANANNSKLPAGVTYTKGTTDDKEKVAVINFPDRSTIDISHAVVAKPEVPTFTRTAGDEEQPKLQDIDRVVSGTALQSATKVILELQTGKKVEILANDEKDPATLQPGEGVLKNGVWTYKLENNMYLRQTDQTAEIGSSPLPVKVKQIVFDAESDTKEIRVAKERNFDGKTITAAKGSQTLTDLKTDARKGINYTEKGAEKAFPGDFTATWVDGEPNVEEVGTRKYKVRLTETSSSRVDERDVTITVTNPVPAELTHENKQNGTTRIKLPDDADKVVFTIPGDNQLNTVNVTHSERDGWTVPANSVLTKDGDYLVVKSKDVGGTRNITAVATKGEGNLKSAETATSITVPEHTVTTDKVTKPATGNPTDADLLNALTVDNKESATLKEGTTYPKTFGTHTIKVVVTYNDKSIEEVDVTYEVPDTRPAAKAEIKTVADAEKQEIEDDSSLTTAEKTAAKAKVDEAQKAADKAIQDATDADSVATAKESETPKLNVHTNGDLGRPVDSNSNSANTNNGGTTTPADSNSNSVTPGNSGNTPAPGVTTDDSSNSNPATPSSTVGQAQASTPAQETSVSTNTPNNSGTTVTPSETRPVDKSELARLVEELETRLKDLDGIDQSVIDAAKVILGEGQAALRNADLTEAGLKEMTAKVKEALESLKGKQATKDEEEAKETRKEQGHLPYGTMIGSLLALLGLLLFLIARRKKESELKKLTKELTKVLQDGDLTNVDAKVLDQAREALAQAVAFLANEKESDHTEDELIDKLKAILTQLR
ncbi:YSIRK-type signal peptide-containing protein [Streptococcus pseudopneumoniae]|uniref:YSIRK-type signal peptide-containing protein n=1 Tax=Streptococcus pseudopneumoniae TaxID=257758 RepID=UPI00217607C7|nr:DUF1542 domain-containing protein [Streptococcus pseudopneumoniae]